MLCATKTGVSYDKNVIFFFFVTYCQDNSYKSSRDNSYKSSKDKSYKISSDKSYKSSRNKNYKNSSD
jgi:hypothetical protein